MENTVNAASGPSLYEALGGAGTVREAVDRFYARVLADPAVSHFFTGIDLPRLKRHQVLVITGILGGPKEYAGAGLRAGHAGLNITDADYNRVGAHLLAVLDELGAGPEAAATVSAALAEVCGDIVGVPAPGC
jgi:hemoglobin